MPDIPKIKRISEIGEEPFRLVNMEEAILQGWDKTARKMLYLFKDQTGTWAYFDKNSKMTVQVPEWRDKEALVMGKWIKMSLYYRLHVAFENPITYSIRSRQGSQNFQTYEGIILVPKAAYEMLQQQMVGRDPNSFYRFKYKQLKSGTTVDGVFFVK